MRIRVISRETFNEIVVNVPENIRVRDFKRKIYEETGDILFIIQIYFLMEKYFMKIDI